MIRGTLNSYHYFGWLMQYVRCLILLSLFGFEGSSSAVEFPEPSLTINPLTDEDPNVFFTDEQTNCDICDNDSSSGRAIMEAGKALEDGEIELAKQLATSLPGEKPHAKLVLARLAVREESYDEALKLYTSFVMPNPDLDFIRITEFIDVLFATNAYGRAAWEIGCWLRDNRRLPPGLKNPLLRKKADAYFKSGQYKMAARGYKKILSTKRGRKNIEPIRLAYGKALLADGQNIRAIKVLEPIAFKAKKSWLMDDALHALENAGNAPKWSNREKLLRSSYLLKLRAWDMALETIEPVVSCSNARIAAEARWLKARITYYSRKRYHDTLKQLDAIQNEEKGYKLEAKLLKASALSKLNRDEEAVAIYQSVAKQSKYNPILYAKVLYTAARLDYFLGNHARALKTCKKLLTTHKKRITPKKKKECQFTAGMSAFLLGKTGIAADYFFLASKGSKSTLERTRHLYWRGMALLQKKPQSAAKLFRKICKQDTTVWYAQLSAQRLEEIGLDNTPCQIQPLSTEKTQWTTHKSLEDISKSADFLHKAGFFREAGKHLARDERRGRARASEEALMSLYAMLESPQYAILRAYRRRSWPPQSRNDIWRAHIAYPSPYARLVRKVEKKQDLPEHIIYAIARKESLFNPHVISYAGAMGLMQFMPHTYELNRIRASLPPLKNGEIPGPVNSIIASGYELSSLMNRFHNTLPLAIMAYNAGEAAVARWLERTGDTATDVFVEKCAFKQTRRYVRLVYQNLARYRQLAGDPSPRIPRCIKRNRANITEWEDKPEFCNHSKQFAAKYSLTY